MVNKLLGTPDPELSQAPEQGTGFLLDSILLDSFIFVEIQLSFALTQEYYLVESDIASVCTTSFQCPL